MINLTSLITAIANAIKVTKSSARSLAGPRVLLKRQVSRDWSKGEPELHFVQLFCCDSGEFLDVGANTGVYSAIGRLVPIAEFDIRRLQSVESVKQLADAESSNPRPAEYINNFIFLPDESTALLPQLQSIASDLGHARRN